MNQKNQEQNEIKIERVFNTKPSVMFKMWTDPDHFSKWYGPKGFTVPECELDVRPGGKMLVKMKSPDGKMYPSPGIYHQIVENEKLVFSLLSHYDNQGNPQVEMLNSIIFEENEGKTKMTMHIVEVKTIPGVEPLKGLDFAWNSSFDKLEIALNK